MQNFSSTKNYCTRNITNAVTVERNFITVSRITQFYNCIIMTKLKQINVYIPIRNEIFIFKKSQ